MSSSKPNVRASFLDHVTGSDGKTRYKLQVSTDRCQWQLLKRYSEVDALRKSLSPKFSSVKSSDRFFPPKNVKSGEKIAQERQELFQTWFAAILSDNNVVCDAATIEFLQLNNIWRAIEAGDERYLELLLSAHVPLRAAPFDSSLMPLHSICKSGFVSCADVLLRCIPPAQRCVIISELDMVGMSPLHITSAEGHVQLTSLLLQHGASLKMCSRTAGTPLHTAVRRNRRGVIDVLVAAIVAGGDVTLLDIEDYKGRSPLHYAVHFRMRDVVQLLLKSGASVARSEQQDLAACNKTGHNVLHVAAALNDHDMIRIILSHMRQSADARALCSSDTAFTSDATLALDIPALLSQSNAAGYTALHVAAAASATECIAELLRNGATVESADIFGNTSLHLSLAAADSVASVLPLLTARADPNLCNADGNSAVHIAALHNRSSCLQLLLQHGGDPGILNVYGLSSFVVAQRMASADCLNILRTEASATTSAPLPTHLEEKEKNSMFTWGFGSDGRLGHGVEESLWQPTALCSDAARSFVHISVGGQSSCAADSSGKMYTWGFGGSKRLGHGSSSNELVPRVLQALASVHVTRVTCGHLHVAAVTSIGSVFTWGDGDFGKLGHGNVDSVSIPTFCRNLREAAVDVACGRDHTLALSSTGILFAWGSNKDGRLGVGHTQTLYEPNIVLMEGLVATCVAAGWDHSAAVIGSRVYTWGRGVMGQLGDGECQSRKQPFRVCFPDDEARSFVSVKCGSYFTVALADDGRVFTWGDPNEGKLGLISALAENLPSSIRASSLRSSIRALQSSPTDARDAASGRASPSSSISKPMFPLPQELPEFGPLSHQMFVVEVACGSSHTLVRTRCCNVCCWGIGIAGQLGLGRLINFSPTPAVIRELAGANVTQLCASLAHSACLVSCRPQPLLQDTAHALPLLTLSRSNSLSASSPASDATKAVVAGMRERGDSWKLMQHLAEKLKVPITATQQELEPSLPPKSPVSLLLSTSSSSPASQGETSELATDVHDSNTHHLSRMVLQSLQFSELSSTVESTEASSTFGSRAQLQSPAASHEQRQTDS